MGERHSPLAPLFLAAFQRGDFTYRGVAAAAGRSMGTVHAVLHGRNVPTTETAYALAVALDLTDLARSLAPAVQVIDEAA